MTAEGVELGNLRILLDEYHASAALLAEQESRLEAAQETAAEDQKRVLRVGVTVFGNGIVILGVEDPERIKYTAGTSYARTGYRDADPVSFHPDEGHVRSMIGKTATDVSLGLYAGSGPGLAFSIDGTTRNENELELVPDLCIVDWGGRQETNLRYASAFDAITFRLPTEEEIAQFGGEHQAAA